MASASSAAAAGGTVRVARVRKAMIGVYKILGKPLGRGGSATVYRVSGADGRHYAMKELAPQFLGDKDAVARFRREFEITQELDHPGIVRTYELLEANGTLNIRMELVEGAPLKALLTKQKRLAPEIACWIAAQVARTLAFAHGRQVIHRDVKPDNILIDREGHVLLGDFGTARLTNLALTRAGTLIGTPVYMAPELLAGKKDAVATPASDAYSLGAVLYEMIEGRSPFAAGRKGEILPLLYAKSFQKPRPMSKIEDPELAKLIESCLAREATDRPGEMKQLVKRLEAFASKEAPAALREMLGAAPPAKPSKPGPVSEPSLPRPAPPVRPAFPPIHDRRFAIAFFATVALLIAGLLMMTPKGADPDADYQVFEVPYRR